MGILDRVTKSTTATNPAPMRGGYTIPPDLQRAIDAIAAGLSERAAVDDALARKSNEQFLSVEASRQADDALTEIETRLALEVDEAVALDLEAAAEEARKLQFESVVQVARVGRVTGALQAKAIEVDQRIKRNRDLLQREANAQAQVVFEGLAAEFREAAKPLVTILRKAHAASSAFGVSGALVQLFDSIHLPSLNANEQPLINGFRATDEAGNTIDLQTSWREDPAAAAIAVALQPLADIRRRVGSHVEFTVPKPESASAAKYENRTSTPESRAHTRRFELENEERRAAAEAARPRVQPQPSQVLGIGARN